MGKFMGFYRGTPLVEATDPFAAQDPTFSEPATVPPPAIKSKRLHIALDELKTTIVVYHNPKCDAHEDE